jgi:hypothetical protein
MDHYAGITSHEVTHMLAGQFPDVATMLSDATEDLLAFSAFPALQ